VRLFRDVDNVVMDLNGIEPIDVDVHIAGAVIVVVLAVVVASH